MSSPSSADTRLVALAQKCHGGVQVHQRFTGDFPQGKGRGPLCFPVKPDDSSALLQTHHEQRASPGGMANHHIPEPTPQSPGSSLSHQCIPPQPRARESGTRTENDSPDPVPVVLLAGSSHHCSPQKGTFLLPRTRHSFVTAAELWPKYRGGAGLSWGLEGSGRSHLSRAGWGQSRDAAAAWGHCSWYYLVTRQLQGHPRPVWRPPKAGN